MHSSDCCALFRSRFGAARWEQRFVRDACWTVVARRDLPRGVPFARMSPASMDRIVPLVSVIVRPLLVVMMTGLPDTPDMTGAAAVMKLTVPDALPSA
jgi:hypothetical protein